MTEEENHGIEISGAMHKFRISDLHIPDWFTPEQVKYIKSRLDRARSSWEAQGARCRPGSEAAASAITSAAVPISAVTETDAESAGGTRLPRSGAERNHGDSASPSGFGERSERSAPSPRNHQHPDA